MKSGSVAEDIITPIIEQAAQMVFDAVKLQGDEAEVGLKDSERERKLQIALPLTACPSSPSWPFRS